MDSNVKTRKSNGAGSIYYDEKRNKWCAEIQWSDSNGNKHRKKFSGQKKTIVKNKLEAFKRELIISNGNMTSNNDITFQEFAEYWLGSILKNKLKPTSYTRKQVTLENQVYPYLGNTPITQITHFDVQDMINNLSEKGLSYSSIKKAYEAVNGCIKEYRIKTRTSFNPCEGITLPINNQRDISNITFFDEEQRKKIKDEATRKYKTGKPVYRLGYAIVVLMYTGMRIGELLALNWSDLDFKEKTITINKNAVIVRNYEKEGANYKLLNQDSTKTRSGNRVIPMSNIAYEAFQEIYKINGDKRFVMSTESGNQVTPININRIFHSIIKKAGVAEGDELCGVHTLRHTFASMLFQNGCDVKIVSELLGHSSTKITENIYIHIIQKQKIKAIQDIDKYSN